MQENKITKQGLSKVTPTGNFVANLAIEFARRVIRNQEKVVNLLAEAQERFPKMKPEDIYTLLGELQQLGIDCTPNEWLYFTPVEYRTAALQNSGLVKNAKIYGSRHEDILAAITEKKSDLKEIQIDFEFLE